MLRIAVAVFVLLAVVSVGLFLARSEDFGREPAFAWAIGAVFGFVLQRSRFCFFCNLRDFTERRQGGGVFAILLALVIGLLGYHVITGAWIVDAFSGHLPPKAHIAPIGWHLVAGGFIFGLGMALSGSCISAHLYRLGEGALVCVFALVGLVPGFILGFISWNPIYLSSVVNRPAIWLPAHLGFFGALILQVIVLGGLAFFIWKKSTSSPSQPLPPRDISSLGKAIFIERWPGWVGGLVIGLISAAVLLRLDPLGVTSEFSRLARWSGDLLGLLPERLEGLDAIRGCGVRPADGFFSRGVLFLFALVLASLSAALISGDFSLEWPRLIPATAALAGGVLLGFGSVLSFGCTIGTLLSGVHASALSGWIFGLCLTLGILAGLPLRRKISP